MVVTLLHMKLNSIVWGSLVGVACMCLMLGTAAAGEKKTSVKQGVKTWDRVVLVEVTGSRIPQRVIIRGHRGKTGRPQRGVKKKNYPRGGGREKTGRFLSRPGISSDALGGRIEPSLD